MKTHFKHPSVYIFALLPLFAFLSCTKEREAAEPGFDVTIDKSTVAVNENITFSFTGSADMISFYSGEQGKEYKYRERSKVEGKPQLQFNTLRQFGTNTSAADATLSILVSTDFKNVSDAQSVQSATWTDISNRAKLSVATSGQTAYTPSGIIDLSDFNTPGIPVYIAFRFKDFKSAVSQRTWTINGISIDNKMNDGSLGSIANISNLTWGAVNVMGTQAWTFSATQLQMSGGAANTPDNEDWLITKPLYLDNVQRDYGVNVKGNPVTKPTQYEYAFKSPGTYTVTFEAINANRWDKKIITKEFTITVQ